MGRSGWKHQNVSGVLIAHSLPDPRFGPAQGLHGATYTVEAEIRTGRLNAHAAVMDIAAFRGVLRGILDEIDYRNLDDLPAFRGRLSTAEQVANHLATRLVEALRALSPDIAPVVPGALKVTVRESPVAYASFECPL